MYKLTEHWFRKFRILGIFDHYPTSDEMAIVVEEHFDAEVVRIERLDSQNHLFIMVNDMGGEESVELLLSLCND
jgi:hypothetical protein